MLRYCLVFALSSTAACGSAQSEVVGGDVLERQEQAAITRDSRARGEVPVIEVVHVGAEHLPPVHDNWWTGEQPCPDNTSLRGAPPPVATSVWCELSDGRAHGPLTRWHDPEHEHSRGWMFAGTRHGLWTFRRGDGTKRYTGLYRRGTRDATWRRFHANGKLASESRFEKGAREGIQRGWYENGRLRFEGSFRGGKKHGDWAYFYDDGTVERQLAYSNGNIDGVAKGFYQSGTKSLSTTFVEGVKHGPQTRWHENGGLEASGEWRDGERYGTWSYRNENGDEVPPPEVPQPKIAPPAESAAAGR